MTASRDCRSGMSQPAGTRDSYIRGQIYESMDTSRSALRATPNSATLLNALVEIDLAAESEMVRARLDPDANLVRRIRELPAPELTEPSRRPGTGRTPKYCFDISITPMRLQPSAIEILSVGISVHSDWINPNADHRIEKILCKIFKAAFRLDFGIVKS